MSFTILSMENVPTSYLQNAHVSTDFLSLFISTTEIIDVINLILTPLNINHAQKQLTGLLTFLIS